MKTNVISLILIFTVFSSQFTLAEVNKAIEYIEYSKHTHVIWRAHIIGQNMTLNESDFNAWYKEHRYTGTIESHTEVIRRYDHVLGILYRLQDLLDWWR